MLIDEYTAAHKLYFESAEHAAVLERLIEGGISALERVNPSYKDFPVLVMKYQQLHADVDDAQIELRALKPKLKVYEQNYNKVHEALINAGYLHLTDYVAHEQVWVHKNDIAYKFEHIPVYLKSFDKIALVQLEDATSKYRDYTKTYACMKSAYHKIDALRYFAAYELCDINEFIRGRLNKPESIRS